MKGQTGHRFEYQLPQAHQILSAGDAQEHYLLSTDEKTDLEMKKVSNVIEPVRSRGKI